ncbi:MAG TPA: carboxymuconolactone decarboxylase family protein [Solirubrobacteraceae bacterium]|jgi:4-carboxymuconolactone decarboxylase|nr:carboxymuconolactone decarboxylase family protein [Solirubrobacteraceae bacterium]
MTRITAPARSGPIVKAALATARRKTKQMTARETESMIEPLEAFAHAPALLFGYAALELGTERAAAVPKRLKELVVLKAATMMGCEYCMDIGSAIARRSGLSDEQLLALAHYRESGLFDEIEMLALDYAVALSRTPVVVADELFDALRAHFDDRALVELTQVIALENFRSRFNMALDIGSAGFSEGMVCAVPDSAAAGAMHPAGAAQGGSATGNGAGSLGATAR